MPTVLGSTKAFPGKFYDKGVIHLNVKHPEFGAVGDGVTDDTAAIQAAIDFAGAAGGGVVFIPKGVYLCGTLTNAIAGITLQGAGSAYAYNTVEFAMTRIVAKAGTTVGINFAPTEAVGTDPQGCYIKDLEYDGNSIATYGIRAGSTTILNRTGGRRCQIGLHLTNGTNSAHLNQCYAVRNTVYGLYVSGASSTIFSVRNSNFGNNIGGLGIGIRIEGGFLGSFSNCVIESNSGPGLSIYRANGFNTGFQAFKNCWFEDNGSSAGFLETINIDAETRDEANAPDHILFDRCRIATSVAGRRYHVIACAKDVEFRHCSWASSTHADALTLAATAYRVHYNTPSIDDADVSWTGQITAALAAGTDCWRSSAHGAIPVFADNAAAVSGGLLIGDIYRTSAGIMMTVTP